VRPHAAALRCAAELEHIERLVIANGADRQRTLVGGAGLVRLMTTLADSFVLQRVPVRHLPPS
jgi:hypothetical protein